MFHKDRCFFLLLPALAFALLLAGAGTAMAGGKHTKTVDGYTMTLAVLPAEPFISKAEAHNKKDAGKMVNGAGASPVHQHASEHPNHHLVVFLKKNGKPVEHANVSITYTRMGKKNAKTKTLPVTQMWVAGKGMKSAHFGNNVHLAPGRYRVHVTVNHMNHSAKATFKIKVAQ